MNLHKLIFTENACYKAGRKITPKGIMVHSTGANNPNLKRYVGPDDGLLGKNQYGNHWNQDKPDGREVCPHAFIGKLADGSIATYQVLPWDHRGWHCGSGSKGSGNDTHISFEICEDDLTDADYFSAVYQEAVELCAYLCKEYGLTAEDVICHSEGHDRGIASNHGDVLHWFPKHGKNMDDFRADVKKALTGGSASSGPSESAPSVKKSNAEIADEVIAGKWGNGDDRKAKLKAAGYDPDAIQALVNSKLKGGSSGSTSASKPSPGASFDVVTATYRVRTTEGRWLPEVKDLSDYAGLKGYAITDVAIKVSKGSVKYRVHVKGGGWLGWIGKYDLEDAYYGYAGNGKPIDAIQVYYYTPDSVRPYKKAKYHVSPVGDDYYPWQYDTETKNSQDGYAGSFGRQMDRLQVVIE